MAKNYMDKYLGEDIEVSCENCCHYDDCDNAGMTDEDSIYSMDGECGSVNDRIVRFKPIAEDPDY